MRRVFASISSLALAVSVLLGVTAPAASAVAVCPPAANDGKTIGKIVVKGTSIDVKRVNYPKGGELDPPRSPLNVGISTRHMPLSSPIGSSILAWHINYNGCIGKLNVITRQAVGSTFTVVDEKGFKQQFKITQRVTVPKGKYRPSWFTLSGPRQLVMVTCTGTVRNGHYDKNLVVIAKPVVQV